jgi:hypothetical protein
MKKSSSSPCRLHLLPRIALLSFAALSILPVPSARASSHSDAPLIKLDPQANLTDVYAFIRTRPGGERALVVEVSVRPFSEPGDGAQYEAFSPDARYSIHITNPVTGAESERYDLRFSPVDPVNGPSTYKNGNTILRYGLGTEVGPIVTVGDNRQNFTQTYSVARTVGAGAAVNLNAGGANLLVAPPNVGLNTTPAYNDATGRAVSGATSRALLDNYTRQTTYDLPAGTPPATGATGFYTTFAGPREDGFYADTPAIFDLLNGRILNNNGNGADSLGQDGNGVDGFKGFNVLHFGIVIPLTNLSQTFSYTGALQPASTGVGVYASVSRPRITLRSATSADASSGPWVQVNRLGNPLFNEALVAAVGKDAYNRTSPSQDAALFSTYANNSELAALINAVYGTSFVTTGRADLAGIFIPDVIRVNTTTGATKVAGEAGFNRLSFIGGDTIANGAGVQIPAGWPNGRRFGDDVIDIALTAIASGPSFATITVVGDNAATNDQVYNRTFPYAATPHSGTRNSKDQTGSVGF